MKNMKRSMEAPGSAGREKTFRRQNPVSCQFCRSKKLKCDRATPCSNCVARSVDCVPSLGGNPVSLEPAWVADRTRVQPTNQPAMSNENIESRLKRLEDAVFQNHQGTNGSAEPKHPGIDGSLATTASWLESVAGVGSKNGMPSFNIIESNVTANNSTVASRPGASQVVSPGSSFPEIGSGPATPLTYSEIVMGLPDQSTASILCNHYLENVSWVYHIIHTPTFISQLSGIYASLNAGEVPNLGHLAIVATIISIGAYFKAGLALGSLTREEVRANCNKWGLLSQRAVTDAGHNASPTLETLQATVLICQYLPNFAQTEAHTSFIGSIITSAHKLRLHQADSRKNRKLYEQNGCNHIELEVKRRIWWHIVSTDWILGFMSGPQSGTYLVNPVQMNVQFPSNCDDVEITADNSIDHPLDVPTEMSYSRCKIILATTIRELVDESCAQGLEVEEVDYSTILIFDQKFVDLLTMLPWYFRLDEESRRAAVSIDKKRPCIRWQRNMAHFGLNTRLSRLHRPYLALGYKNPAYAYSRMVCLRSARLVIQMEQEMREVAGGFNPDSGRLWIIVHHTFVATITLVMDYCLHRDDPQAAERKAEILRCYQILEKSQEESSVARKGLAHLKQVMMDWKAKTAEGVELDEQDAQALETGEYLSPEREKESENSLLGKEEAPQAQLPMVAFQGLDMMQDIWLDPFQFNMPDHLQWEELFQSLEKEPI